MTWFKILKENYNPLDATPTIEYITIPLRRIISLSYLEDNILEDELIYCNLENIYINKHYSNTLQSVTDLDSFIVVLQDSTDATYFKIVNSTIVNNVLYFEAGEDHLKNINTSKYYSIYYGLNDLAYVDLITLNSHTAYQKSGTHIDINLTPTSFAINLNLFNYQSNIDSNRNYTLALYNAGIDWIDGASQKESAKAFGIFDGPNISIYGNKSKNSGIFKIRILEVNSDNTMSSVVALDWTEVDCYSETPQLDVALYTNTSLGYGRYIFEIETISDKNIMSTSNSVTINSYRFLPNYKLVYGQEEFNPDLSFVRIGGIK